MVLFLDILSIRRDHNTVDQHFFHFASDAITKDSVGHFIVIANCAQSYVNDNHTPQSVVVVTLGLHS